jgi:hypothetical protein
MRCPICDKKSIEIKRIRIDPETGFGFCQEHFEEVKKNFAEKKFKLCNGHKDDFTIWLEVIAIVRNTFNARMTTNLFF